VCVVEHRQPEAVHSLLVEMVLPRDPQVEHVNSIIAGGSEGKLSPRTEDDAPGSRSPAGGVDSKPLREISNFAHCDERDAQPSSGVDAALGDSFSSRGKSNIGDDCALVTLSPGSDLSLSSEVDNILHEMGHLRDFPGALNKRQLENALSRLENVPRHLREISNSAQCAERDAQPRSGVDAALGAAFSSHGYSNIGDDGAIVPVPHAHEVRPTAQVKLEEFGQALAHCDLDHLIEELKECLHKLKDAAEGTEFTRMCSSGSAYSSN
jgi:hypothetical protein